KGGRNGQIFTVGQFLHGAILIKLRIVSLKKIKPTLRSYDNSVTAIANCALPSFLHGSPIALMMPQ
ncbi:hypothetical protein LOS08_23470, partial [Proteus mirabilis]|uniref:hypothetical protein n=1 Tax=Proteus mirabilis TaxID=584 RepID=UPI001E5F21E5